MAKGHASIRTNGRSYRGTFGKFQSIRGARSLGLILGHCGPGRISLRNRKQRPDSPSHCASRPKLAYRRAESPSSMTLVNHPAVIHTESREKEGEQRPFPDASCGLPWLFGWSISSGAVEASSTGARGVKVMNMNGCMFVPIGISGFYRHLKPERKQKKTNASSNRPYSQSFQHVH